MPTRPHPASPWKGEGTKCVAFSFSKPALTSSLSRDEHDLTGAIHSLTMAPPLASKLGVRRQSGFGEEVSCV